MAHAPSEYEHAGPKEVFEKVFSSFYNSLPNSERKEFDGFPDSQTMLESIRQICQSNPVHSSRLTRFAQKLQNFAVKLNPYFEVVNIFVQTNPLYAGLVWGTIRLVFQVGFHYVSFIEKLGNMLDKILMSLPAVESYVSVLKTRADKGRRPLSPRLTKALACVYADLIQFCQDLCKIFSLNRGLRFRAIIIKDLCWRPFDERFGDFLKNLGRHSDDLELEMKLDHATTVLDEFDQLRNQLADTERLLTELKSEGLAQEERRRNEAGENLARKSLRRLIQWICPPIWKQSLENALNRKLDGTCQWLFDDVRYQEWEKGHQQTSNDVRPVLLVLGKPGYGKTHLCASLVERVRQESSAHITMFYFFDKQQPETCQASAAFRAILTQLLLACAAEKEILDIVQFAMGFGGLSDWDRELTATRDDILCLIRFITQRLKRGTFIFDGVDECADPQDFFQCLREATSSRQTIDPQCPLPIGTLRPITSKWIIDCKVVLFSRPDLRIPNNVLDQSSCIQLNPLQNSGDIRLFLHERLQELVDDGLLMQQGCADTTIEAVSARSDGMFLWVRLLLDYLQCDALSYKDRTDALNNLVLFEGLDQLYHAILQKLHQTLPAAGKRTVGRAFQWVAGAGRPLRIDEVAVAITSTFNEAISEHNVIPNLEIALTRISGSLLELTSDRTVRFVHASVSEYLYGNPRSTFGFGLQRAATQSALGTLCLSYLYICVPTGPLSGSTDIAPSRQAIRSQFPLLEYCLGFWVQHCHNGTASDMPSSEDYTHEALIRRMDDFLTSKAHVTTWIEASWLFGVSPKLDFLVPALGYLLTSVPTHSNPQLVEKVIANLWLLSEDLKRLTKDWHAVLKVAPNEIWQPSISGFTSSDFWSNTQGALWKRLDYASPNEEKAIMIESQVSEDSMELALIKVLVPRNHLRLSRYNSQCTIGWRASYEVWSLKTSTILFKLFIDLAPRLVERLLCEAHSGYFEKQEPRLKELEFQFPVRFGPGFRSVMILSYLVNIQEIMESKRSLDPTLNCWFSVVDVERQADTTTPTTTTQLTTPPVPSFPITTLTHISHNTDLLKTLATSNLPGTQTPNTLIIGKNSDGLAEASMLQQDLDSLVLQSVVEDGTARQETLSRIPKEVSSSEAVLLRPLSYREDTVNVVWNKASQAYYSFDEVIKEENVVVLERRRDTIPTVFGNVGRQDGFGGLNAGGMASLERSLHR